MTLVDGEVPEKETGDCLLSGSWLRREDSSKGWGRGNPRERGLIRGKRLAHIYRPMRGAMNENEIKMLVII